MGWLEQLAPTVASCLGGPLAGLAVEAVSKLMGTNLADTQALLNSGKMTADQIASVQQAEIALKAQAQSMNLDFAKLAEADMESARTMQTTTRSWVPGFLAIFITSGFFGILAALMLGYATKSDELMLMLGGLGTAWTGVVHFYFGSSSGSQAKDQLIYQSTPL